MSVRFKTIRDPWVGDPWKWSTLDKKPTTEQDWKDDYTDAEKLFWDRCGPKRRRLNPPPDDPLPAPPQQSLPAPPQRPLPAGGLPF